MKNVIHIFALSVNDSTGYKLVISVVLLLIGLLFTLIYSLTDKYPLRRLSDGTPGSACNDNRGVVYVAPSFYLRAIFLLPLCFL